MTGFRPFFGLRPVSGPNTPSSLRNTGGKLIRLSWRSVPGGVITEGVHPYQGERLIASAGEAHFTPGG
jgi:hypothetical protein